MTVLYIFYIIFLLIYNTTGMSHLKITSSQFDFKMSCDKTKRVA
jgi:hypothetical protein